MDWIATFFCFLGVFLNAKKNIWCWFFWQIGNLLWIWYAISKKEHAMMTVNLGFVITNAYGWYCWKKSTGTTTY